MKVVLFCGGFGMRLREYSESIPKPMVNIGYRPILWHVMKYYAHYGHKDFILCLGWRADAIKKYFLNYEECISNDFVMSGSGDKVELISSDIHDWKITFVDTGTSANIGERLYAVKDHLKDEEMFLANYSDGLTDAPLPRIVDFHQQQNATATFLSVKPLQSFHTVRIDDAGFVDSIEAIADSDEWINAGFFVMNSDIFNYLNEGEELVEEPFHRLIAKRQLATMSHNGFFGCMDTFKEKQLFDDMYARGNSPWEVWKNDPPDVEHDDLPDDDTQLVEHIQELSSDIRRMKEINQNVAAIPSAHSVR